MTSKKQYRSCPQSPLEFKDVEMQKWWLNLFDQMEKEHFRERHKIGSVVHEVVAQRTYAVLQPILNLERSAEKAAGDEEESPDLPTPSDFRSLDRESLVSEGSNVRPVESQEHAEEWADDEDDWDYADDEENLDEEEEESEDEILPDDEASAETSEGSSTSDVTSLFVEAGGAPHFTCRDDECDEPYTNPYLTFLKLPKAKAAIWRPMKDPIPTGLDEPDPVLDLHEKAALVTYLISKEFYDWFKSIGGTEVHTFSDKVLAELFCVGFDQLAAHALCSRIKEMPTVPTGVAAETGIFKADYRMALKKEIKRDSKAEKIPRRTYAFGNTITYPDRWVPPHNNADKWLKCFRVRPEIASFSMVWQGITHLSSTKAFVHYLKERPQLPRPEYLKEEHMFDPKVIRKSVAGDTGSMRGSPSKDSRRASSMHDAMSPSEPQLDDKSSSSSSADDFESSMNLAKYGII